VATQDYIPADLARVCGGNLRVSTLVVCHPGTKRLPCLPCFSELPVQPYDNMGSILIEYVVRVHPWVLTEGGIWVRSDPDG
jgi:hypothetical protein